MGLLDLADDPIPDPLLPLATDPEDGRRLTAGASQDGASVAIDLSLSDEDMASLGANPSAPA